MQSGLGPRFVGRKPRTTAGAVDPRKVRMVEEAVAKRRQKPILGVFARSKPKKNGNSQPLKAKPVKKGIITRVLNAIRFGRF